MIQYPALFEPDTEAGGFVVTFPDLRHGATQGETEEEALAMAEDFLICVVGDYIEEEKDLPEPRKYRGKHYRQIGLPALASAKVELYRAFRVSGIRKAELARRLKIPKSNVGRLFQIGHSTRLEHLDAAFRAVGKRLLIQVAAA
jgi:antitoxin HicB